MNNYLAVKEDGGLKRKGIFVDGLDLRVSPKPGVIPRAVAASLLDHTPVERTVRDSTDLHDFLYAIVLRNAHDRHGEQALGKVLRWYRSTRAEAPTLMRLPLEAGQPSRVPDGERAALALDLPDRLPEDLDREHYAAEAEALLKRVTAATRSLVVLSTKTDAEQFRQYHADGEVALFCEGVTEMVLGHQDRPQGVRMLVTYARSALGRAMNLGQYGAVLVDARPCKPGVGTLAAEPTEEAVRRAAARVKDRWQEPLGHPAAPVAGVNLVQPLRT